MKLKYSLTIFFGIFLFLFAFPSLNKAFADTITWDGGGGDNNWSTCANWFDTTSSTNDVCPGSADAVVFNSTSTKSSTVDASFTGPITSLSINSGYSGTITMAEALTISTTFTQSAGSFTASNQTLTITTNFTLNTGGTFTASSGTTTFGQAFTYNGGTFNANSGTAAFTGSGAATINCANSVTFNLVTFNNSATRHIQNCTLPLGSSPTLSGSGTIDLASSGTTTLTWTGTLTKSNGLISLNSGTSLPTSVGLSVAQFTVQGSTTDLSTYTSFTASSLVTVSSGSLTMPTGANLNGGLTISGGTFTAPSGNINIGTALSISGSPTFNNGSGSITFNGSGTNTLTCGTAILYDVTVNTSGTRTLSGSCSIHSFTLTAGTFGNPASSANLTVTGDFAQNANTTLGGANLTVSFTGSGTESISKSTGTFSSIFNVANSATAQLTSALTVSGQACTVTSGLFYLNGNNFTCATGFTISSGATLQIQGAETVTSPTLNAGSIVKYVGDGDSGTDSFTINNWSYSTLTINATDSTLDTFNLNNNLTPTVLNLTSGTVATTGATSLAVSGLTTINGATWNPSALSISANGGLTCSSGTFSAGSATIAITGALTISGCAMTAPSSVMTITGNFAHSSGTFTANSGTVSLTGTGQQISGSTTFYNLSKTVSSADTLTFVINTTQTITNTTTLTGVSGNLLSLRSSSATTQFSIDPEGSRSIDFVNVQDSNNINATTIAFSANNVYGTDLTNWTTVAPTPTPSPSSASPSIPSPPVCTSTAPSAAPIITSAKTEDTSSIILSFIGVSQNVDHYVLEYGTQSGKYLYGLTNIGGQNTTSYVVNFLHPNTPYYFRIMAVNGCMPGPWSKEFYIQTSSSTLVSPTPSPKPLSIISSTLTPNTSPSPTPQVTQNQTAYSVKIKVTDSKNNPVQGANVTIHSQVQQGITDSNGNIEFDNLEGGAHKVLIAYNGYQGEENLNLTGDNKNYNLNITAEIKNAELVGPLEVGIGFLGIIILILIVSIFIILKKRRTSQIHL